MHEINLSVPMLEVPPKTMNVTVYQCLPHRNAENPQWEMWPYNDTGYDPYEASHKCCSAGRGYNTTVTVPDGTADMVHYENNIFGDELDYVNLYAPDGTLVCTRNYIEPEPCPPGVFFCPVPECLVVGMLGSSCGGITLDPCGPNIKINFLTDFSSGEYTIEQIQNNADDYPPWGAWMPIETICYGGVPKISILDRFISADLEEQPGILGATTTEYSDIEPLDWKWNNDVIIMSFMRSCSGDRGNICSGIAERFFKRAYECEDMKPELGEVESCKGAPPSISEPVSLEPTGDDCPAGTGCTGATCIQEKCYGGTEGKGCVKYPQPGVEGNTFEQAFGLNKSGSTIAADGTCNPVWTCSKKEDVYDVTQSSGKYLLKGATCNNRRGNCSEPRPNVEGEEQTIVSCEDYNGLRNVPIDESGTPDWFCQLSGGSLKSQNFTCTKTLVDAFGENVADCTPVMPLADPDSDRRLCLACLDPSATPQHANGGIWREDRDLCCGDDAGEGGFPYGTATITLNGGTGKGKYGGEVCDDYYGGNKYLQSSWIDNNCDGKVACKDPGCTTGINYDTLRTRGYDVWKTNLNPAGGLCCNAPSQCKQFLDPTLWTSPPDPNKGVNCNTVNNTCDCVPVGIGTARTIPFTSGMVIRTCVAPGFGEVFPLTRDVYDRNFTISGSHNLELFSVEDVDHADGCSGGKVKLYCNSDRLTTVVGGQIENCNSGSFYFENTATKDCLVTVRIT